MPPSLGVVVRQRSVPVASGTHGDRPQHSAAVLQVCPGLTAAVGIAAVEDPRRAAVGAAGAGAEAARQAERVVGAALRLGRDRALAVAFGVGAGVGITGELADPARHLVPHVLRADADADVPAGGRRAGDGAGATAAALAIGRAEAVQDLAAEPGLADVHAGERPGAAVLAAAAAATVAQDAVVRAVAGAGRPDVHADAFRGARGLRTEAAAAVEIRARRRRRAECRTTRRGRTCPPRRAPNSIRPRRRRSRCRDCPPSDRWC